MGDGVNGRGGGSSNISDLLGTEYVGYKGQAAIDKH